jgi:hypothetical protein
VNTAQTIIEGIAIIVVAIVVLCVCFGAPFWAVNAFCRWKMKKLWEQMTPEQRIEIRCKEMADAIRKP